MGAFVSKKEFTAQSLEVLKSLEERKKAVLDGLNVDEEKLKTFVSGLTGHVISIRDEDQEAYNKARSRCWNTDVIGYPSFLVRVKTPDDVSAAIKFSKEQKLSLCIASGCHGAKSMLDGAFVVDFFEYRAVNLDTEKNVVVVESGCTLEDIDKVLKPYNLGFPLGTNPYTGIAGLTLAGGWGFLGRLHGFAVDNLIAVDAVLPSGEQIHATDDNEYADFIKASRGGGGNFGIITRFHFQCHTIPSESKVLVGENVYLVPTIKSAISTLLNFSKFVDEVPNEVFPVAALPCGVPVLPTFTAYIGDKVSEGIKGVPELKKASKLGGWVKVVSKVKTMDYHTGLNHMLVPHQPSGNYYQGIVSMKNFDEKLCEILIRKTRKEHPNSLSSIVVFPIGGAALDKGENTSLGHRNMKVWIIIEAQWDNKEGFAGKEKCKKWTKSVYDEIKALDPENMDTPHTLAGTAYEAKPEVIYGEKLAAMLKATKAKYDPENILNQNRNIKSEQTEEKISNKPTIDCVESEKKLNTPTAFPSLSPKNAPTNSPTPSPKTLVN